MGISNLNLVGLLKLKNIVLFIHSFMENCDQTIYFGLSILFLYDPVHQACFLKSLFMSEKLFQTILKLILFCEAAKVF